MLTGTQLTDLCKLALRAQCCSSSDYKARLRPFCMLPTYMYVHTYIRTYNSQSVSTPLCAQMCPQCTQFYFYFYLANEQMSSTHSAGWLVSTYNVLLLRLCAGFEGNGWELAAKILQPLLNIGFRDKVCRCGVVYTMSGWTHNTTHARMHAHTHTQHHTCTHTCMGTYVRTHAHTHAQIYTTHTRTYFVQNEH